MKLDLLPQEEYQKRYSQITYLQNLKQDNSFKVKYSEEILSILGDDFHVSPPPKKSSRMKLGLCYSNAVTKMSQGFEYVEGIIVSKDSGLKISHAWNVDSTGKHIDFTLPNTDDFLYKGVIVPKKTLYDVGYKNGCIWYCCLPYLKAVC
jgi:hypothetical protein